LKDTAKHQGLRNQLISVLKNKGITDRSVLDAIQKIPRHLFLNSSFEDYAYQDKAFPIGAGQTISQPYTVAYQTELLHIQKGDKVLEIGTGSGYQTCILMELGAEVFTIERQPNIYQHTIKVLPGMGYKANFYLGDGSKGIEDHAPYDKIIVTAGAPFVPEILLKQLKIGGILVIPVGDEKTQKMITVIRASENDYDKIELDTFRFVPLVGDQAW
jgi:protein-L-isoaspartate(D-aspartate) O-methyltransferase